MKTNIFHNPLHAFTINEILRTGWTTEKFLDDKLIGLYRVGHLLADMNWVNLDLESSQAGGPLL